MTQAQRVYQYMQDFGQISSLDAFRDLGVTRLSARIYELRGQGIKIASTDMVQKNRCGETCRYSSYSLVD